MLGISGQVNLCHNSFPKNNYDYALFNKFIKTYKKLTKNNISISYVDKDYNQNIYINKNSICLVVGHFFCDENNNNNFSKSEYVFNIFQKKGAKAACSLNGSYIFFIKQKKNYYIGIDSNSYIPLYYSHQKNIFVFSFDIEYVKKNLNVSLDINYYSVFSSLLCGGMGLDDNSRIKSIKKLDSGTCINFNGEKVLKECNNDFFYLPKSNNINYHLENVEFALQKAIMLRASNQETIGIGLSGGLDSRILITSLKKYSKCKIKTHTYGKKNFIEHFIAKDISNLLKIAHTKFIVEKDNFLDAANSSVILSAGQCPLMSGPQLSVYEKIKDVNALMFGSFFDYTAGASGVNPTLTKLRNKKKLLEYYEKNYLLKIKKNNFINWFNNKNLGEKIFDYTISSIKENIKTIDGDNISDINTSFFIRCRGRRWYNNQLLFPLLNHNVRIPFYDVNFLKSLSEVPVKFRYNDTFRIKLLKRINHESSKIILTSTMSPAHIEAPKYNHLKKKIFNKENKIKKNFISSNFSKKFESTRFDANFFEWISKYKIIQKFFYNQLLSKKSLFINKILKYDKIFNLINDQINGKKDNLRLILLLTTYENFYKQLKKNEKKFRKSL